MARMLPPSRPQITRPQLLHRVGKAPGAAVFLVGWPGYYLYTMGKKGENDRGIYDDAIFLVTPNVYATFNANVDPSVFRRGIATLEPGTHLYRKGPHGISRGNPYPAFRPANKEEALPVRRDGQSGVSKGIAINIHRGSWNSTSSLGCQTLPPSQWEAFQKLVYAEMDRHGQKTIPYVKLA
jgi:lysozyme